MLKNSAAMQNNDVQCMVQYKIMLHSYGAMQKNYVQSNDVQLGCNAKVNDAQVWCNVSE